MPNRIIFALQKGGVGKTTSTAACAEILSAAGYKVLCVDFDPQGNLTKMLTQESIYKYTGKTIMEAVADGDAEPYIIPVGDNLDLIPAEDNLATFSRFIYTSRIDKPYATLKRVLEPVEAKYDYVFVDVGPTLGDTLVNAIVYTDYVITPVDLGDFAMDALIRFLSFVDKAREEGHTAAQVIGILLTMRDNRTRYDREVSEGIREAYSDMVFRSEIRRRTDIKEMSGVGVNMTDPAMEDYIALSEEIIERIIRKGGKTHE